MVASEALPGPGPTPPPDTMGTPPEATDLGVSGPANTTAERHAGAASALAARAGTHTGDRVATAAGSSVHQPPHRTLRVVLTLRPATEAAEGGDGAEGVKGEPTSRNEPAYAAILAVGVEGCDPVFRTLQSATLAAVADELPALIADAHAQWQARPRYPRWGAPAKTAGTRPKGTARHETQARPPGRTGASPDQEPPVPTGPVAPVAPPDAPPAMAAPAAMNTPARAPAEGAATATPAEGAPVTGRRAQPERPERPERPDKSNRTSKPAPAGQLSLFG